jgi:hypothetical protein
MESTDNVVLYRPVGQRELDLIRESGFRAFPPRLPHQPIFYPVTNEAYARELASEWNANSPIADYVGYVTRFAIQKSFIDRYTVQKVGGKIHMEYWIPAEELAEFNAQIVGLIEVIAEYRGKPPASPSTA